MVGHVTSSYDSAALGRPFCLALLAGGRGRHGETVLVPLLDRDRARGGRRPGALRPGGGAA